MKVTLSNMIKDTKRKRISSYSSKPIKYLLLTIFLISSINAVYADTAGTDIAAEYMGDAFATIKGTGFKLLLTTELVTGIYIFSTSQRSMKVFAGFVLVFFTTLIGGKVIGL